MSDPVGGSAVHLSPPGEDFVQDGHCAVVAGQSAGGSLGERQLCRPVRERDTRMAALCNGVWVWDIGVLRGHDPVGHVRCQRFVLGRVGVGAGAPIVGVTGPVARYREGIEHARHRHIHFSAGARPDVRKGRILQGADGRARVGSAGPMVGDQVVYQEIGHGSAQAGNQVVAGPCGVTVAAAADDVVIALGQAVEGLLRFTRAGAIEGWLARGRAPWLARATRPAQQGADKLVPPTTSNGLVAGRLYGLAIQAPVAGSATRETSGVGRPPVVWTFSWYAGSGS